MFLLAIIPALVRAFLFLIIQRVRENLAVLLYTNLTIAQNAMNRLVLRQMPHGAVGQTPADVPELAAAVPAQKLNLGLVKGQSPAGALIIALVHPHKLCLVQIIHVAR